MSVRTSKLVKAPKDLTDAPYFQDILYMNGMSVIEACTHTEGQTGTMFLEDHLLLCVLQGQYTIRFGSQTYTVHSNEMVLMQKSIVIEYEKSGFQGSEYFLNYMMFFLKDDLINEFIKMADLKQVYPAVTVPVSINPITERLVSYLESLKSLFKEKAQLGNGLVKIKLLELLYDLADANDKFLYQFLQLKQKERRSLAEVVEENIYNPVSLDDLAYLSGRSLTTFKREFKKMYNTSPIQWIRNRRLDRAKQLLEQSPLSVTEICFTTGFENVAHFSKVFKEKFGVAPSLLKQAAKLERR